MTDRRNPEGGGESEVIVRLTVVEAQEFINDSRRLDAYVIARSGGGIQPSKRRAEVRRKLREALEQMPEAEDE